MLNFDGTITLGNLITLVFGIIAVIGIVIRHRERVQTVEARCVLIETNTKSRCDLLEQQHLFLKQQLDDDRSRSDRHWDEVKVMLNKISDKLDTKADKP